MGGAGLCTTASVGADQATPELTKTSTDAPNYATPTTLEVNHFSLNLALTTGLDVQELTLDTDIDVTPAGSFGANDDDLNYLKSKENLPKIKNTNSDLSALIEETGNIHEVVEGDIEELHTLSVIFNQDNKLEPVELVEEEANQTKDSLENGGTPQLLNQLTSQSSPQI